MKLLQNTNWVRSRFQDELAHVNYDWNFNFLASPETWSLLASGALMTLWLSFWSLLLGTLIGLLLGIFAVSGAESFAPLRPSLSSPRPRDMRQHFLVVLRGVTLAVIDILRSIPLLILILFSYYFFPFIFPFAPRDTVFWPVLFALSINLGAFVAELIRASVIALAPTA
jgi:ABC-type amino acid transport system permease subunit